MSISANKLALVTAVALASSTASAAMFKDRNGNVGYSSMAECNQAIADGSARFYRSHTKHRPKRRKGERSVRQMRLAQVSPKYANGSCDRGTGRRGGRDGVARALQGKYVPYSPNMLVNVFMDKTGNPVRVSMAKCDNWFSAAFPAPHVKPYVKEVPKKKKVVAVAPTPTPTPAALIEAAPAASGLGLWPVLGAAAAVGVAAAVLSNSDDSKKDSGAGTGSTTNPDPNPVTKPTPGPSPTPTPDPSDKNDPDNNNETPNNNVVPPVFTPGTGTNGTGTNGTGTNGTAGTGSLL